jgi:hypothetical protein
MRSVACIGTWTGNACGKVSEETTHTDTTRRHQPPSTTMMAYIVSCESVLKTLEPGRARAEVLLLRSGQGHTLEHLRVARAHTHTHTHTHTNDTATTW